MRNFPDIAISRTDLHRLTLLLNKVDQSTEVAIGLTEELERATLLSGEILPDTVIGMNSRVTFQNLDTGKVFKKELVFPHEIDSSTDKISILTPAGAAMLGLSVGSEIEWLLSNGKILKIGILKVERKVLTA
ncbi:MAG: transcription elongation factor GreAB [Gammaproteobacteria bacterium]|nr:transcription elongation factor GreAB [Gammaproteobacteria bacterium]|tara:strand:+ start:246 stop:641 length:396 start_codon:yes stop_codon:yes gene_type:complete